MTTIILDTESTGVIEPIEPVEMAWLRLESPALETGEFFEQRYRPSKPIELGALATHHIMDEELMDCPASSTCKLPDDVTVIVGHNIDFDYKVIGSPKVRRIDTLAMARKVWPMLDSHKMGALLYHIERARARVLLQDAHSALQDCRNCLVVLRAIAGQVGGFASWHDMWRFSGDARVPTIWPFGKHKGIPIEETPRDYLEWCLRQKDMDRYVLKAVKKAMAVVGQDDEDGEGPY